MTNHEKTIEPKNRTDLAGRLDVLVMRPVDLGIAVTLRLGEKGKIATFESGFYKSDGLAWMEQTDTGVVLHTRYGQINNVSDPIDIIEVSRDWFENSKDRYSGWSTPAPEWAALYDILDT